MSKQQTRPNLFAGDDVGSAEDAWGPTIAASAFCRPSDLEVNGVDRVVAE